MTNPLENPASTIGIPESLGATLQKLASVGLNSPTQTTPAVGPRIDNENSFLGMIQYCKNTAASSQTPFNDPTFNTNCGMCMTSGTLLTGETFTTPTGVVVYPDDKKSAFASKKTNRYPFPRAVPSLKAATCMGASLGSDATPVLALTAEEYEKYAKNSQCQTSATFGNGCGVCVPTKAWSFVDTTIQGNSLSVSVFGSGTAAVYIAGKKVVSGIALDATKASTSDLGPIAEGTLLEIEVLQTGASQPFLYAAFQSILPDGTPYTLSADRFMERDSVTGNFVRHGTSKYFKSINAFLPKLLPGGNAKSMKIGGPLPVTFIQADEFSAYSCPSGPFVTQQNSYNEMMTDDPCANPAGQGPGNYEDGCLRQVILKAGCTSSGSWYANPFDAAGSMDLTTFKNWITLAAATNGMGCTGVDTSTPCDPCLANPTAIPTVDCLKLLYSNQSHKTKLGSGYPGSISKDYTSLQGKVPQFCQPAGLSNPANENGAADLLTAAKNGYNGKYGMEAVKDYLSDIYNKATNTNLNIRVNDSDGGSKTSWMKCFGLPIVNFHKGTIPDNAINAIPDYEKSKPFIISGVSLDKVYWINNASAQNVKNNQNIFFYKTFTNTSDSPISAFLYKSNHDKFLNFIRLNGVPSRPSDSKGTIFSIVFPPGENVIEVYETGMGIFAVCVDTSNTILFNTDSSWMVTPP